MNEIMINGQGHNVEGSGGAGRYAEQFFSQFQGDAGRKLLPDNPVRLVNFDQTPALLKRPEVETRQRRREAISRGVRDVTPPIMWKAWASVRARRRRVRVPAERTDRPSNYTQPGLLHEITNYSALNHVGRWALDPRFRLCVTFLDVQDIYYPQRFTDDDLTRRRLLYSFFKDRGDAFLAISEFTKQTMIEGLGIDASKITVTYLGLDARVDRSLSPAVASWADNIGRFLFYPARYWANKNHEFLIRCVSQRSRRFRREGLSVVLTGGFSASELEELGRLTSAHGVSDLVRILGFQSDEQIRALFQRAEFLIFPSLYEGFGIPLLEAMQFDCPILASRVASIPEIAGGAACFFDPEDEDSLVAVLDRVLDGSIDRQALIEEGRRAGGRFSWQESVARTVAVYRSLI